MALSFLPPSRLAANTVPDLGMIGVPATPASRRRRRRRTSQTSYGYGTVPDLGMLGVPAIPAGYQPPEPPMPDLSFLANLPLPSRRRPNIDWSRFRTSLADARSIIEQRYAAALAEIAANEQRGYGMTGQLPARYDTIYGDARTGMDQAQQAIAEAQTASRTGGTEMQNMSAAGAVAAPMQQALDMAKASRLQEIPLLNLGIGAQASRARLGVEQEKAQYLADLAAREAEMQNQLAELQMRAELGDADAADEWERQLFMSNLEHQQRLEAIRAQNALKNRRSGSGTKGRRPGRYEVTAELGMGLLQDASNETLDRMRSSRAYRETVGLFRNAQDYEAVNNIIRQYMRRYPRYNRAISLALVDSNVLNMLG